MIFLFTTAFGVAAIVFGGLIFNDSISRTYEKVLGLLLSLIGFGVAMYGIFLEDPTFFIRFLQI